VPIFEFVCDACRSGRKFSVLVGVVADAPEPRCPACGSENLTRAVSRFARTTESMDGLDQSDSASMRSTLRELVSEAGEDELSRDEVNELVEESLEN
jgi:putative FmdB family regulatory protein